MRPIQVVVGGLASASATKISLSQTVPAATSVVMDGAASTGYSANSMALSQAVAGAAALTLTAGAGNLVTPAQIVIVSAGNDSGITFAVVGIGTDRVGAVSETVTGANTSRTSTKALFSKVTSITSSGAAAGNVSAGTNGVTTLDKPRQVLFTSGGNDTGVTFTITGTSWSGNAQTTIVTGASGATAASKLDFLSISQILASAATASTLTVGTNGIAGSPWVRFDDFSMSQIGIQCTASGTVNYTIQQTLDDPNDPTNAVAASSVTWVSTNDTAGVNATGTIQSNYAYPPRYARIFLNSGTGTVTATFIQASSAVL